MPERVYKYLIRCAAHVGIIRDPRSKRAGANVVGEYLQSYDPEFMNGEGLATWTKDPNKALWFPTITSAMALANAQPRSKPIRPDGQPNRPLRAYTLEVMRIEEALELWEATSRDKNGGST